VRCLYERFDLVFAPSRVMCSYLEDLGVHHVAHQPLGVDTEVFHPRRRTPALRPRLGLPAQARVLIFAGRFAGEKNLPLLLQAFARLGAPYHLLLIGGSARRAPPPTSPCCPTGATASSWRNGSPPRMRWSTRHQGDVRAGDPGSHGVRGVRWWQRAPAPFRSSSTRAFGVLAAPNSVAGMTEAIAALYERDLDAIGAAARARVLRQFTWQRTFHGQFAAYASLVGAHRLPLAPADIFELGAPTS